MTSVLHSPSQAWGGPRHRFPVGAIGAVTMVDAVGAVDAVDAVGAIGAVGAVGAAGDPLPLTGSPLAAHADNRIDSNKAADG